MSLVKGLHHVSMKCSSMEEYKKTVDFYKNITGSQAHPYDKSP